MNKEHDVSYEIIVIRNGMKMTMIHSDITEEMARGIAQAERMSGAERVILQKREVLEDWYR